MYTVRFWQEYAKKDNSTARPAGANAAVELECEIMDGSGMLTPTLLLRTSNPTKYNYAYIDTYHRYYRITNWRYDRGLWYCTMQVDPLASWKDEIKEQTLYVLRSASRYNGRIVDNTYPTVAQRGFSIGGLAQGSVNPFNTAYSAGYFVVGIINTDTGSIGAVSYYVFTPAQFKNLVDKLMGDVTVYGVTDISDQLTKVLANPFQYVVSCYWFPFSPPTGGSVSTLQIGWWSFNISCSKLSGYSRYATTGPTITVPKHPDALSRGYYLLTEPFTEYYLYMPPWGSFSLPADKLVDSDYITFDAKVDCITGMGQLRVFPWNSNTAINVINAQIGVPIELAQMAPQLGNLMNQMTMSAAPVEPAAAPAASGKMTGVDLISSATWDGQQVNKDTGISQTILDFASNIGTMLLSKYCPTQTIGTNGGIMAGYDNPQLYAYFTFQTDIDDTEKGRPLCERVKLGSLSGFTQCGETDIRIGCTKPENDMIRTYLASGFYLE